MFRCETFYSFHFLLIYLNKKATAVGPEVLVVKHKLADLQELILGSLGPVHTKRCDQVTFSIWNSLLWPRYVAEGRISHVTCKLPF